MGLRGPAPKPSAIERAEGYPGKRKRNTEEPQPAELTVAEVKRRPQTSERRGAQMVALLRGTSDAAARDHRN